jgi:hypothetical protein
MKLTEFKNQVYHIHNIVVIPSLSRLRVNKIQFMVKGRFKQVLLDIYLEKLYKQNYK